MIRLCCEYLYVRCIWLYVIIMSRTSFSSIIWPVWLNVWVFVYELAKWLWVRIALLSFKLQIWRLLRARNSLKFRQTIECGFTLKVARAMITTYSNCSPVFNVDFNQLFVHRINGRDYSFSTYAKFSEKLHFLPPDMHMYMCVSGGKKCLFFGKFYASAIKIIPKYHFCVVQQQTTALQRARRKVWSIIYNP